MLILDKGPDARVASYVKLPDSAGLTPSGDFTFEFFDVIFASVAAQGTFYSHYNASSPFSNQRSLLLDFVPGTGLRFGISTDGTSGGTTTLTYS
jgi:hypothetical protein